MTAPTDTVVLMPHALGVAEETLSLLEQLARERWNVHRHPSCSDITQARSAMASWALEHTSAKWLLWLDADMGVTTEQLERLRSNAARRDFDALALGYVHKKAFSKRLAIQPAVESYVLGRGGDFVQVTGCGFGCVLVSRRLYLAVAETLPRCVYSLPPAHFEDGEEFEGWAFHSSLVEPIVGRPGLYTHHGEDYSFVRRSMALGFKWWWDTRERLGHWGPYRYEWEDAGRKMPREASIAVNQKPAASRLVTPAPRNLVDARRV